MQKCCIYATKEKRLFFRTIRNEKHGKEPLCCTGATNPLFHGEGEYATIDLSKDESAQADLSLTAGLAEANWQGSDRKEVRT